MKTAGKNRPPHHDKDLVIAQVNEHEAQPSNLREQTITPS